MMAKVTIKIWTPPKIQVKGGKSLIMRPTDALIHLRAALAAAPRSRERQLHLEAGLTAYYFGLLNEHRFKSRGDRRGSPSGGRIDDTRALALMKQAREDLGDIGDRKLARHVLESGSVPVHSEKESAIRRLTRRYRRERRL
jgi:hypothetical protein